MKKDYNKPEISVYEMVSQPILAGTSLNESTGGAPEYGGELNSPSLRALDDDDDI